MATDQNAARVVNNHGVTEKHGIHLHRPWRAKCRSLRSAVALAWSTRHVGLCAGFRLPECRSIDALRRPAAEKRQGTKSREVERRRGSGRYGDL